jgi:hypothetical protein
VRVLQLSSRILVPIPVPFTTGQIDQGRGMEDPRIMGRFAGSPVPQATELSEKSWGFRKRIPEGSGLETLGDRPRRSMVCSTAI